MEGVFNIKLDIIELFVMVFICEKIKLYEK
jgi:hypothetical protein